MDKITEIYSTMIENKNLYKENTAILNLTTSDDSDVDSLIPRGLHSYLYKMEKILYDRGIELSERLTKKIDDFGHPILLTNYLFSTETRMTPRYASINIGIPSNIDVTKSSQESNLSKELKQAVIEHLFPIIEKYRKQEQEGE